MDGEPTPTELRRAEVRDVVHIMDIDAACYPQPWSRPTVLREVTSDLRVHLVAQRRFDLVAHGAIAVLADVAHVTTLAVRPELRRQGLGRDLFLGLVRAALAAGCTGLTLEVRAGNTAALALYRSFGLRPSGVRRGYYGDTGEDALVLWSPEFDDDYRRRVGALDYTRGIVLSPELTRWEPIRPIEEELAL